jgi:penicillin-binding protein 2
MPDGAIRFSGEGVGTVPDADDIAQMRRRGEADFSEVIMGIGQGPIAWTPLQAANAYATLARGGSIHDATLIGSDSAATASATSRGRRRQADLEFSRPLVDAALEGLRQSVEEHHGTGNHISHVEEGWEEPIINAEKVTVWAKTGTAQAPPMPQDSNQDGRIDSRDTPLKGVDHSWFVGLVGPKGAKRPLHAVAVIVEYGGSGGRTAGPIANQIIRALQVEGYLPGDGNAPVNRNRKPGRAADPAPEDDGRQE